MTAAFPPRLNRFNPNWANPPIYTPATPATYPPKVRLPDRVTVLRGLQHHREEYPPLEDVTQTQVGVQLLILILSLTIQEQSRDWQHTEPRIQVYV